MLESARKKAKSPIDLFADIKLGDLVVYNHHNVADINVRPYHLEHSGKLYYVVYVGEQEGAWLDGDFNLKPFAKNYFKCTEMNMNKEQLKKAFRVIGLKRVHQNMSFAGDGDTYQEAILLAKV